MSVTKSNERSPEGHGKTVIVLGAGVGGLTAAHELVKRGYRVEIYERNAEPGGIARSATEEDGEHNEVTWHAVAAGYNHLLRLLGEIPAADGKGMVAERLVPTKVLMYGRTGERTFTETGNSFITAGGLRKFLEVSRKMGSSGLSVRDIAKMGALLGFARLAHPGRFERYEGVTWEALIADLSDEGKKWASNVLGTFTGMHPRAVSAHCYLHLARPERIAEFAGAALSPDGDPIAFYHFDGPMNRVWFDPWVRHLRSLGVGVHLNEPVAEIRCSAGRVDDVLLAAGEVVRADHYVTALDPGALAKLLRGADDLAGRMAELDARSKVLQMQVAFTFDEKIVYDGQTIFVLPDAPWGLLVRAEGSYWKEAMSLGACKTREVLSAAFAVPDVPGILYGKPAHACTREQIVEEIWAQLGQATGALRAFRTEDGRSIDELKYTSARIWQSFQFDPVKAEMSTYEPKFSNNVGTLALRPRADEPTLRNLVHSGAYTRTDANTHHMESAAEAGTRAANLVATGRASVAFERYPEPKGLLGAAWRVDRALHARGYRHPFELLITPAAVAAKIYGSKSPPRPAGASSL